MSDLQEPKAALRHYLQSDRDALRWKLDGLGERDLRMPPHAHRHEPHRHR